MIIKKFPNDRDIVGELKKKMDKINISISESQYLALKELLTSIVLAGETMSKDIAVISYDKNDFKEEVKNIAPNAIRTYSTKYIDGMTTYWLITSNLDLCSKSFDSYIITEKAKTDNKQARKIENEILFHLKT